MDTRTIKTQFFVCQRVFERNLEGVDDTAARKRPSSGANSVSWLLGHVANARLGASALLGGKTLDDASELDMYAAAAAESFDDANSLPLDVLRDFLHRSHAVLATAIDGATDETWSAPAPFSPTGNPDETVGSLLATLAFHEAYHCGQVGRARRDLGLEGQIKGR